MFILMLYSTLILIITIIILTLSFILSKKSFTDREKSSPFECGFDPKSSPRIPFSLRFFLIAIIFLIFDVEITLIFPIIYTFKFSNLLNWLFTSLFFIIILLIGLYHEWNQGALNWSN